MHFNFPGNITSVSERKTAQRIPDQAKGSKGEHRRSDHPDLGSEGKKNRNPPNESLLVEP